MATNTPTHQNGHTILEVFGGMQETVLGGTLDRVAERADRARNDRDLLNGVCPGQRRGDQRVPHLVVGDAGALVVEDGAAVEFGTPLVILE